MYRGYTAMAEMEVKMVIRGSRRYPARRIERYPRLELASMTNNEQIRVPGEQINVSDEQIDEQINTSGEQITSRQTTVLDTINA